MFTQLAAHKKLSPAINSTQTKPLGFLTATSLVIGAMLGAGIFGLPAALAAFGTISLFSWIITAAGTLFLALTFIELNRMLPQTGGAFLYAYHAYGEYMGFAIAASYWFAWCVGCAATIVVVTDFLAPFLPYLNERSTLFNPYLSLLFKIGLIWLTIIINMLGITAVGRVQLITTLLKLIPLFLLCIFGFSEIKFANLVQYYNISGSSNSAALMGAATLTLFAFAGFEAAVVPSEDVSNHRTIAWSTIMGTLITALLYVLVTLVFLGTYPAVELKNTVSPFNQLATSLLGPYGAYLIAACAVITIVGSVNGGILILIQDAMAASRNKLLPALFSKTNNRFKAPIKGLLLSGILITILLAMTMSQSFNKQFNFLVLLSTLSLLIPYFVSTTAALLLMLKDPGKFSRGKYIYVLIVASIASIYAFWTFIGAGQEIIFYGCLFFFATFWFHLLYKWYQLKVKDKC